MQLMWNMEKLVEAYTGDDELYQEMIRQMYVMYKNGWISIVAYEDSKYECNKMKELSYMVVDYERGNELFEKIYYAYYSNLTKGIKEMFLEKYFSEEQIKLIFNA